jgi:hypothetical protein
MPPPKYIPSKTLPPRVIVGADGISRKIVYYVTGERKSAEVVPCEVKTCTAVPVYCKSRRMPSAH